MVEDEVAHAQFGSQATSVEGRAMTLLVGLEGLAVGIEAEGLGHQPVGLLDEGAVGGIVGVVAQAGHHQGRRRVAIGGGGWRHAPGQFGSNTVLLLLRGVDVAPLDCHVAHGESVAVLQLMEDDTLRYPGELLLGEDHVDDGAQDQQHLVVAIDVEMALVVFALGHHADHPDHAQHMVGVGMGDEEVVEVADGHASALELPQHAVASASSDEEARGGGLEEEARVVALGHGGVGRAQHDDLILS